MGLYFVCHLVTYGIVFEVRNTKALLYSFSKYSFEISDQPAVMARGLMELGDL